MPTPFSADDIRCLILLRLWHAYDTCNSGHLTHVEGQIRALLTCLNGEIEPPLSGQARDILDRAGIPWQPLGKEGFKLDDDWLRRHGFELDEDDEEYLEHPRLGGSW